MSSGTYIRTPEIREKNRVANAGRPCFQSTREKISKSSKGIPRPKAKILLERFEEQYIPVPWTGCWLWIGSTNKSHNLLYGVIFAHGKQRLVHRLAYEIFAGPIPEGLTIDHLCRVTLCVNPQHMEPVTQQVNTLRGQSPVALNAHKTHCPAGHELVGDNLRINSNGARVCRACRNERCRIFEKNKRRRLKEERNSHGRT